MTIQRDICLVCGYAPVVTRRGLPAWQERELTAEERLLRYSADCYWRRGLCADCDPPGEESLGHKRALHAAFLAANPQLAGWKVSRRRMGNALEMASPKAYAYRHLPPQEVTRVGYPEFDHAMTLTYKVPPGVVVPYPHNPEETLLRVGGERRYLVLASSYDFDDGVSDRARARYQKILAGVRERDLARREKDRRRWPWQELIVQITPRRLPWWHAAGNLVALLPAEMELDLTYPWPSVAGAERDKRWADGKGDVIIRG